MRSRLIEPEEDPELISHTALNSQVLQILSEMGFSQEFIEISMSYTNSTNINELLAFMIKGENGWDHEFIPNENSYCEICKDLPQSHAGYKPEPEQSHSVLIQKFRRSQGQFKNSFTFSDSYSNPSDDLCEICLYNLTSPYSLPQCSIHLFCMSCISKYLEVLISDSKVTNIKCPGNKCTHEFTDDNIKELVSEGVFNKYLKFKQRAELLKDSGIKWCIRPDCEGYMKGTENDLMKECPICAFQHCFKCGKAWHPKKSCDQVIEADYEAWAKGREIQLCPSCKHKIEKIEGCNHMTCSICGYNFCWLCRGKYTSNHFSAMNPFGCPNLQSGFNTREEWPMWKIYCARLKGLCFWMMILILLPLIIVFGPSLYITVNFNRQHYYHYGFCRIIFYDILFFILGVIITPLGYAVGIPYLMIYGTFKLLKRCSII